MTSPAKNLSGNNGVMFALCWFPVYVNHYFLFVRRDQVHPFSTEVQLVITWIADANNAINPCIYIPLNS